MNWCRRTHDRATQKASGQRRKRDTGGGGPLTSDPPANTGSWSSSLPSTCPASRAVMWLFK